MHIRIASTCLALAILLVAATACQSDPFVSSSATRTDGQMTFSTPKAAVDALIDAARRDNRAQLRAIFGPELNQLESGERSQDRIDLQLFVAAFDLNNFLFDNGDESYTLVIGLQEWEFPAPIVRSGERWRFDTDAGVEEVISRTIGVNELHVIDVADDFVAAQNAFHAMDSDSDGVPEYAASFRSQPGKRDGLYWPDAPDAPMSPFGPLVAQAFASGELQEHVEARQPYRGYYYRILTGQGPGAPGGAMDYIDADGRMTKGFALIAWPAAYDLTGVMSFLVSSDGLIYQRDLGEDTSVAVERISAFDPSGWDIVQP